MDGLMQDRERATSLRTLYAAAGAFAGEPLPGFLARALMRALSQELQWIQSRAKAVRC